MVVTNYALNIGKEENLNSFNDVTHIAFGSGTDLVQESQTELVNEEYRVEVSTKTKDTINNTYTFSGVVTLPHLVGVDISEIGLFNDSVAGNMAGRIKLNTSFQKTGDDELFVTIVVRTDLVNV